MSSKDLRICVIGVITFIVFSIQYFIQSIYLGYMQHKSLQNIEGCYRSDNVQECLVSIINDRNFTFFDMVNPYLITIAIVLIIAIIRAIIINVKYLTNDSE